MTSMDETVEGTTASTLFAALRRLVAHRVATSAALPAEPLPPHEFAVLRQRLGPSLQVSVRDGRVSLVAIFRPSRPRFIDAYALLAGLFQDLLTGDLSLDVDNRNGRLLVRASGREVTGGLDRAAAALMEALAESFRAAEEGLPASEASDLRSRVLEEPR